MRKIVFFLVLASLSFTACGELPCDNAISVPENNATENHSQIVAMLEKQMEGFDNADLESMLSTMVLCHEYQEEKGCDTKFEKDMLTIFREDGTCQTIWKCPDSKPLVDENGDYILTDWGDYQWVHSDIYFSSRECKWSFDSASNTITTIDEYGNAFSATVEYYDGKQLIYRGMICDAFVSDLDHYNANDYYSLTSFVDRDGTWDEWYSKSVTFDSYIRKHADKQDKRLNWMLERVATANGNIDDDLFIDRLLTKTFFFGFKAQGADSGCFYGDVGMYCNKGGIWYWMKENYDGIYLMMEDGTLRKCHEYSCSGTNEYREYEGKPIYTATKWSYDKDTNMLYSSEFGSPSFDYAAEVLYFDGDIAILSGEFDNYPWGYGCDVECLFYIDFTELDRESVLNKYALNLEDFYNIEYVK